MQEKSKDAITFPGQGSPVIKMGSKIWETSPGRDLLNRANHSLRKYGWDTKVGIEEVSKTPKLLSQSEFFQPALVAVCAAGFLVNQDRLNPVIATGHSLGMYPCLYVAGCLEIEQAVIAAAMRGLAMKKAAELNPGAMAAVIGVSIDKVSDFCHKLEKIHPGCRVQIANINTLDQIVISGHAGAFTEPEAGAEAQKIGGRLIILPVAQGIASHSELMKPAQQELNNYLSNLDLREPNIPIISGTDGEILDSAKSIIGYLMIQLIAQVNWLKVDSAIEKYGVDRIVELGPKSVLSAFNNKNLNGRIKTEFIQLN